MKKEIRQKEEKVMISYNVFIAEDGKEFKSEFECKKYEREIKLIKEKKLSDYKKIRFCISDYSDWYYVEDREDFKMFIKALKEDFCRAYVYYCNAKDYYGTWVSFTCSNEDEDGYSADFELISKKELENKLKEFEQKLNDFDNTIDNK